MLYETDICCFLLPLGRLFFISKYNDIKSRELLKLFFEMELLKQLFYLQQGLPHNA